MSEYLAGRIAREDLGEAVKTWLEFEVHKRATDVLRYRKLDDRRAAMSQQPDHLKPEIEKEVFRLWELLKKRNQ